MFEGTDTTARRIRLLDPYISSLGNTFVIRYTRSTSSIDFCHTTKS